MKFKLYSALCALIFTAGCATTHPGNEGTPISGSSLPLKISAETIGDDAENEPFQLIDVTLENTSDEWLKINSCRVVIAPALTSKLSIVSGSDLNNWAQAMDLRLKKEEHNQKMLQTGLVAAGAVTAVAGKVNGNETLANAGASVVVGTYAWAISDTIANSLKSAEQSEKVPANHLYHSYSIPGKMFLRRWVLLNKPSKALVKNLVLEFETVEGVKANYEIAL